MGSAPPPQSRAELLRRLIRSYRKKLTRAEVGLEEREGQHEGLALEDLAKLTGFRPQVLKKLEQGIVPAEPEDLLEAVARALRLPLDEQRALWLLAVGTGPPMLAYNSDPNPTLDRMMEVLHPHPAFVVDAAFNVLSSNPATAHWLVDFDTLPPQDRNYARWILGNPHARHVFVGWGDLERKILSRVRAAASQYPTDQAIWALVDHLRQHSGDIDRIWVDDGGNFFDPPTERRLMRRPGHTDPAQADDEDHHVLVDIFNLTPRRRNDGRQVIGILLPDYEPRDLIVTSQEACGACNA